VTVIVAVIGIFTIYMCIYIYTVFFFSKNVCALLLLNVAMCVMFILRTISLGLGCNKIRFTIDSLNRYAC
jgi:hypothetical protein